MDRGLTLVDTLIGLLLMSIVIAMGGSALTATIASLQTLKLRLKDEQAQIDTRTHVARMVQSYAESPYPLTPRLYPNGQITTAARAAVDIASEHSLRPNPNSVAIGTLRLSPSQSYATTNCTVSPNALNCDACLLGARHINRTNHRTVLLVGIDGITEARFEVARLSAQCRKFTLIPIDGMQTERLLFTPQLIVPVEDSVVLYIANNRTLRLANFEGTRVIERQPLVEGVDQMVLGWFPMGSVAALTIQLGSADRTREHTIMSRRRHSNGLGLLMNAL